MMKKPSGKRKAESGSPEQTLAAVRELSEHWSHRPAPNTLRCVPVQALALKPVHVPAWQNYRDYLISAFHFPLAALP